MYTTGYIRRSGATRRWRRDSKRNYRYFQRALAVPVQTFDYEREGMFEDETNEYK